MIADDACGYICPAVKKFTGLRLRGSLASQNGHAIAEHVTDIEVLAVGHDLDAVRTPADVAVGNVLDPVTDPLRRYRLVRGAGDRWNPGQRRHSQQTRQVRAAALHGFPRLLNAFSPT